MALALYFSPANKMSAQQYNETVAGLAQAGAGHPPGRLYHAAFGAPDDMKVFDVWTSRAEFDKFGQVLIPIMQALGIGPAEPQVMEVHNVITPPAPRPKAATKKKAAKKAVKKAAKKAAPKKGKKAKGKGKK